MGRQLRIDAPGCWHHVMNRGAGRRIVFRDDAERLLLLELLSEFDERFGVEVHAFCLMGNHYHLLVRSSDGRLSAAMKWLGCGFTLEVNSRRGVDGAIFRGRFHSLLVERDAHLTWLYRYINANPFDLGWAERLAEYPWSGLASSLGKRHDQPWLRNDFVRARFGEDPHRLEQFVESARATMSSTPQTTTAAPTDSDIESAIEVARRPGPEVASNAQMRAAHTLLAKRYGLDGSAISTVSHLDEPARQRYLDRAAAALERDREVESLMHRADSVLGHLVSDTE